MKWCAHHMYSDYHIKRYIFWHKNLEYISSIEISEIIETKVKWWVLIKHCLIILKFTFNSATNTPFRIARSSRILIGFVQFNWIASSGSKSKTIYLMDQLNFFTLFVEKFLSHQRSILNCAFHTVFSVIIR